jgi:hypothetical protein
METESYRKTGIESLNTVLKIQNNVNIIEKNLFNIINIKFKKSENIKDIYTDSMYQVITDIQQGMKLKDILKNIKNQNIYWEHHSFNEMLDNIKEQNDFIENPFEIQHF